MEGKRGKGRGVEGSSLKSREEMGQVQNMLVRERAVWSGPGLGQSLLGDTADPLKGER